MRPVEIPADAITYREYMREVAGAELDALDEAYANDNPDYRAIERAKDELHAKICGPLLRGEVVAFGVPMFELPIVKLIPAKLWEHLDFQCNAGFTGDGQDYVSCRNPRISAGFSNVYVAKVKLSREERCRLWLRELVEARRAGKAKVMPHRPRYSGVKLFWRGAVQVQHHQGELRAGLA